MDLEWAEGIAGLLCNHTLKSSQMELKTYLLELSTVSLES